MQAEIFDTDRLGVTYLPSRDYDRLNAQARRVFDVMKDGQWHTLREISDGSQSPEASVSARLRDFRNIHEMNVEKENMGSGTWRYRLLPFAEGSDA